MDMRSLLYLAVLVSYVCATVFADRQHHSTNRKQLRRAQQDNNPRLLEDEHVPTEAANSSSEIPQPTKRINRPNPKTLPFNAQAEVKMPEENLNQKMENENMEASESEMDASGINVKPTVVDDSGNNADELLPNEGEAPSSVLEPYKLGQDVYGNSFDSGPKKEKEKNVAIVPVSYEFEKFQFPKLPDPSSFFPEIKVIPFNLKELQRFEVKVPEISVASPGSYKMSAQLEQEEVEPEWFQPSRPTTTKKPEVPSFNISTEQTMERPKEFQDEEIVVDMPGLSRNPRVLPYRIKYQWPKFLGPAPNMGLKANKNKPEVIPNPKDDKPKKATTKPPHLAVGQKCRNTRQCLSGCCLRTHKKSVCTKRSTKGKRCSVGQLKNGMYAGMCPCSAGDSHCIQVTPKIEKCNA